MVGRSNSVEVRIFGDISDISKKLQTLEKRSASTTQKLDRLGTTLNRNVTLPLAGLGLVATKAASDLGEATNAVTVVFGKAADKVLEFGDKSAEAVGLSKRAFLELATPLGAVFQNFGDDADTAAEKTIELTQRAADMASVFNVDVTEALSAIQAALRGEADPIEKFGVSVNAAAVEAKALALGLAETKSAITDADKAAARYALILEQTARVQGDFANTSDSLANKTRILKANAEDLAAEFGAALLPIMEDVVGVVGDVAEAFGNLSPEMQETVVQLALLAAAASPAAKVLGGVGKAAVGVATALKGLNLLTAASGGGLAGLAGAMKALGVAAGPAAAGLALFASIIPASKGLAELTKFRAAVQDSTDSMDDLNEAATPDHLRDTIEAVGDATDEYRGFRNAVEQQIFQTKLHALEQEELNRVFSRFKAPSGEGFDETAGQVSNLRTQLQLLQDQQRALVDPIFRLRQAEDKLNEAQRKRVEAQTSNVPQRAVDDAILAEVEAFQDLQFARENATGVFEQGFGIIERYAAEAGIAAENIKRITDETYELDRALRGLPTDPFSGFGGIDPRRLESELARRRQQVVE